MSSLLRNLRYSARTLWKNLGLTLTVLLTLTLGIGANTAIFTVDYATLLAPMPYPEPDQLVVWSKIQTFHNGCPQSYHEHQSGEIHFSTRVYFHLPSSVLSSFVNHKCSGAPSIAHFAMGGM